MPKGLKSSQIKDFADRYEKFIKAYAALYHEIESIRVMFKNDSVNNTQSIRSFLAAYNESVFKKWGNQSLKLKEFDRVWGENNDGSKLVLWMGDLHWKLKRLVESEECGTNLLGVQAELQILIKGLLEKSQYIKMFDWYKERYKKAYTPKETHDDMGRMVSQLSRDILKYEGHPSGSDTFYYDYRDKDPDKTYDPLDPCVLNEAGLFPPHRGGYIELSGATAKCGTGALTSRRGGKGLGRESPTGVNQVG